MRINNEIVYIVNPGNDTGISSLINDSAIPALSPLALGTWIEKYVPEVKVVARDGGGFYTQVYILEEIRSLKPGIIGVSVLGKSYLNCLEIAKCGKECGSVIIFGNDHASQLSHQILMKRPYVDFIIGIEYGELPFELLVRSLMSGTTTDLPKIPNICYRGAKGEILGYQYD
ncbi:hypothetical protein A9Q75_17700 [Colwellia psychrerythraea]|uniref:B12-binding domain-containing protein n=1 Tax=Colwellia psychrerythraea TaxID=28229 RepID=A0A1Y5E4Q1_COLPS|nr:hypothetical protein A9Q75_17700 [Colwellia psychrerythraea]